MKTLWKIIKFLLVWAVIAALILLVAYFILDDLLLGLKILAGVFLAWLVIYIVYRLIKRQIAKNRVKKIVNIEKGESKEGGESKKGFSFTAIFKEDRTLYRRITRLLNYLRASKMSLRGSILYAKPWILMMGDGTTRKEDLVERSGINFPITSVDSLKSDDGMIDLYLTNEAVYINTSAELYPEEGDTSVPNQLIQLLKSLYFHRSREPLNSIVMALDAETILNADGATIHRMAEKQRFYLAFFMSYLRIQLPVHLVLTNAEKIEGFSEWVGLLNKNQVHEVLGDVNLDNASATDFLSRAIFSVRRQMGRLISLALSVEREVPAKALSLPNQILGLQGNLEEYAATLFTRNEYQEEAFLVGFYVTGNHTKSLANQTSELPRLSETQVSASITGSAESLVCFARALFVRVLPNDREHLHKLEHFRKGRFSLPLVYFFGSWALGSLVALLGFWFFSFLSLDEVPTYVQDYEDRIAVGQILSFDQERDSLPPESDPDDLIRTLNTASYLNRFLTAVRSSEDSWWIPWERFLGAGNFAGRLQSNFYIYMRRNVTSRLDAVLSVHFNDDFSASRKLRLTRPEIDANVATYASVLYSRIYLLNHYLAGDSRGELQRIEAPFGSDSKSVGLYFRDAGGVLEGDIESLNDVYLQSLEWARLVDGSPNPVVETELGALNRLLGQVLSEGDANLSWIIGWANHALASESYRIEEDFLGASEVSPPLVVDGAYTVLGNELIDGLLSKMLLLYQPGEPLYQRIIDFRQDYMHDYVSTWANYAENVTRGLQRLQTRSEWFATLQQLSGENNPYFNIMNIAHTQNEALLKEGLLEQSHRQIVRTEQKKLADVRGQVLSRSDLENLVDANMESEMEAPEWLKLLDFYQQMKKVGEENVDGGGNNSALQKTATKLALKTVSKAGKTGKAIAKTGKKANKTLKKMNKNKRSTARSVDEMKQNIDKAAAQLDAYVVAMRDLAFQGESREAMFSEIKGVFENREDPSKAQGSIGKMHAAFKQLQFIMGIESPLNKPFWALMKGSLITIEQYAAQEAAEELQDRWGKEVLAQVNGLEGNPLQEGMFDINKGLFWKYITDNVEPFIQTTLVGTVIPRSVDDQVTIPFTGEFIDYATQAKTGLTKRKPSYSVILESGATSVNREALYKPTRTVLSMVCEGGKEYNLVNLNFVSRSVVDWTPKCGDLTLTIDFSVFAVTKIFKVPRGFPEFLQAMSANVMTMRPADFPESEPNLRDINVREIILRYKVSGAEDLVDSLHVFPLETVQTVAKGWKQENQMAQQ